MTTISLPAVFIVVIFAAIAIFILGLPIVLLVRMARGKAASK